MQQYLSTVAAGQYNAAAQAVHKPLGYGTVVLPAAPAAPAVLAAPAAPAAAPPVERWWIDFAVSQHAAALQALSSQWGAAGQPVVAQLFAQAEAARRGGQVPPGMLSWDDGDMIQVMLRFFEAKNLPSPKLSKQSWHMQWVKHERDAGNFIDLYHALDFAAKFCQELATLASQPEQNNVQVAPQLFLPVPGVAKADWLDQYSDAHIGKISEQIDKWDSANIGETVAALFGQANADCRSRTPTILEWHNSEVQTFVRKVYAAHRLPAPSLTQSQWQTIASRFQHTYASGMTLEESCQFVAFLHSEIQKGDSDLHEIFGTDGACDPVVRQQARANDWRQSPNAMMLKGKTLELDQQSVDIRALFAEVDCNQSGTLQWETSEIITFVQRFFQQKSLPVPDVPQAVWYQWFREVDHNNDGHMQLEEAIEFVRHIFERILQCKGKMNGQVTAGSTAIQQRRAPQETAGVGQGAATAQRMLITSSGLTKPTFQRELVGLLRARRPQGSPKVLYIPDAAVGNGCDANTAYCGCVNSLMKLGVSHIECAELRVTTPEALAQKMQGVDCLYVDMGNTYYLRYYMRKSGFDQMVPPLVQNQGVIYVGASAGSMSAGKTISVAFWKGWDDPGYGKEWDLKAYGYDGLNVIPGGRSVFPHYGPQWSQLVQEKKATVDHEVLVLDEEHAFVVNGSRQELVP